MGYCKPAIWVSRPRCYRSGFRARGGTGEGTPLPAPLGDWAAAWVSCYFVRAGGVGLGCLANNRALEMGETLRCALALFNTADLKGSGTGTWGPFVPDSGPRKRNVGVPSRGL